MSDQIQLLQFLICRGFQQEKQDFYTAQMLHSNLNFPVFPARLENTFVVTCWRKDKRFHKEVVEYATEKGETWRSPHMDIEPVTSSVLFRWHKHQVPTDLVIQEPTILTIRVILDGKISHQSYIMIEKRP